MATFGVPELADLIKAPGLLKTVAAEAVGLATPGGKASKAYKAGKGVARLGGALKGALGKTLGKGTKGRKVAVAGAVGAPVLANMLGGGDAAKPAATADAAKARDTANFQRQFLFFKSQGYDDATARELAIHQLELNSGDPARINRAAAFMSPAVRQVYTDRFQPQTATPQSILQQLGLTPGVLEREAAANEASVRQSYQTLADLQEQMGGLMEQSQQAMPDYLRSGVPAAGARGNANLARQLAEVKAQEARRMPERQYNMAIAAAEAQQPKNPFDLTSLLREMYMPQTPTGSAPLLLPE